jgi:transposase-like protein
MERIPASERTREKLKAPMGGRSEAADRRSELVRLAARLIIEEALEGEAHDALGRDYYARGAVPGTGYRNGYRTGRVHSAEGAIEYSAPQIADRRDPFRSRIRELVRAARRRRRREPAPSSRSRLSSSAMRQQRQSKIAWPSPPCDIVVPAN